MAEKPWKQQEEERAEGVKELLVRGFRVWSNNINIAVPLALLPLTVALWSLLALIAFLVASPPPQELLTASQAALQDPSTVQKIVTTYLQNAATTLAVLVPVWFIGSMLLSAFFNAGAIGMSIEANELYRCSVRDAARYGRKHVVSMFLADLATLLVIAATAGAFLLPLLLTDSLELTAAEPSPVLAIPMLAVAALAFLFLPVRYALVADGLGPLDAIVTGVSFTVENWVTVLLLLVATTLISLVVNAPAGVIGASGSQLAVAGEQLYSLTVGVLFTGPYGAVLWTRLYLDRTGNKLVERKQTL